jgi:transcriptional regulator of arginine metabolism
MSKRLRQQAIKDIVSKGRIPSQAALAEELKKLGFDVTQATLSRDIADLELVKSKDGYLRPEDAGGTVQHTIPDREGTLRRLVLKVDQGQNLLVIRTPPGSAHPVAISIDEGSFEEVIGTIGGDDTALVITRSERDASALKQRLLEIIT